MEYKKILALTHSFVRWEGDFAGVFLLDLAKGLTKSKVKVFVLAPHEQRLPCFELMAHNVTCFRFRYAPIKYERLAYRGDMHKLVAKSLVNKFIFILYLSAFFIKTLIIIGKEKVDIIHAHWWVPSGVIAFIVSFLTGKPYIVTCHGTDVHILTKFNLFTPLARLVFNNAKSITAVSNSIKSILTDKLGISANKISVFPMPCDLTTFYPMDTINRVSTDKDKEKIVLSIGRLIELKGYTYLLDAMQIIQNRCKVKLIIIGEGNEEQRLKEQSRLKKLEVEFLGFKSKNDLNYYYNLCDVFVLPSITDSNGLQEGLGLVLLEAMSCKKPVIGTNSGGIPDIVKDNETGLLVPEKDPEALANAIEKLLIDEKLAVRLANNGYNYVVDNFSPHKIANMMVNVYSEA
ncbi:MAG: glycosyltransferase family 4 protein [Candidatus Stahlbacteria bacterium]|nr:glycosyltransferase family 4 protein [Candidatus Stahlbacteria bacterium]